MSLYGLLRDLPREKPLIGELWSPQYNMGWCEHGVDSAVELLVERCIYQDEHVGDIRVAQTKYLARPELVKILGVHLVFEFATERVQSKRAPDLGIEMLHYIGSFFYRSTPGPHVPRRDVPERVAPWLGQRMAILKAGQVPEVNGMSPYSAGTVHPGSSAVDWFTHYAWAPSVNVVAAHDDDVL
jgi:hypothetical protein